MTIMNSEEAYKQSCINFNKLNEKFINEINQKIYNATCFGNFYTIIEGTFPSEVTQIFEKQGYKISCDYFIGYRTTISWKKDKII